MQIENEQMNRLQYVLQAAMRAYQSPMGSGPEQGEMAMAQVGSRVKEALRNAVAQRIHDNLAEHARERVRELVRDRLASELRSALFEAAGDRIDVSRIDFVSDVRHLIAVYEGIERLLVPRDFKD